MRKLTPRDGEWLESHSRLSEGIEATGPLAMDRSVVATAIISSCGKYLLKKAHLHEIQSLPYGGATDTETCR
jgi:hypothetical protein